MKINPVNRLGLVLLVACIALGLTGCPCLGPAVTIPDGKLRTAIRLELRQPLGCITEDDLLDITELQLSGLGITDLEGLQFCTNLIFLQASDNNINSITQLTGLGLPLTFLDLSSNQITDITAVAGLHGLQNLNLDNNAILLWDALTANVSNGGFAEGGIVAVGEETIYDNDGNFTDSFQEAHDALLSNSVEVQILGESGSAT